MRWTAAGKHGAERISCDMSGVFTFPLDNDDDPADGDREVTNQWIMDSNEFVQSRHSPLDDMFAEWKSARYYKQVNHQGLPTGRFIMNFEFYSAEGHDAYKKRRKDWSGPYEEYKRVDPYEHFIEESVKIEYWEPAEEDLWLDFE